MTPDRTAVAKPALNDEELAALREAVVLLEQDTFTETIMNTPDRTTVAKPVTSARRTVPWSVKAHPGRGRTEGLSQDIGVFSPGPHWHVEGVVRVGDQLQGYVRA